MKITEGYMPFRGFETYYRMVGEPSHKAPLVLLHGGPGSTHNYFEVLDDMAETDGRQLIMYDQIGCGNSFVEGHPELFTAECWVDELIALREHLKLEQIHLLGQSWGGMQAIWYAIRKKPQGIKSYILSSTHASSSLWEQEQYRRISYMLPEHQEAIRIATQSGDYQSAEYLHALDIFMDMYCNPTIDEHAPECLTREKKRGVESYIIGWGPNEFTPTGNLADFEFTDELHLIKEPTLVISGARDLSSPYISKQIYDNIPNASWELFQYSRHMPFVEETDKYKKVIIDWMNRHDS